MPVERFGENPLIRPEDIAPTREDLEVYCVINPGAIRIGDEVLLLLRVGEKPRDEEGYVSSLIYDHEADELVVRRIRRDNPDLTQPDNRGFFLHGKMLLSSLSHLRLARSRDLVHWDIAPAPAIAPTTEWESYGCEDARICTLDGRYYVTYTAASHLGINVMLAVTDDFETFEKLGIIATTFNKDVCLFPETIHGQYICRHRPFRTEFNDPCIWTAKGPDLLHWGEHSVLHRPVPGTWEAQRVGCGGTPIRTPAGWLEIHHAADHNGRYCLGAMLSDLEHPEIMSAKSEQPILEPAEEYELHGVFSECVFSNGVVDYEDGRLIVFYGGADTVTCAAATTVTDMIAATGM